MNRLLLSTAVAALILAAPAAFAQDDHHDHKGDKTTQHDNGPKGPSGSMSGPTMGGPKTSGGNMSGPNHTVRSIHTDTTDHHDHTVHTDHTVSHDLSNNNNNNNNNNSDHRVKSKSNISNNMMGGDNNRHSNRSNGNNHTNVHINFNRHNVTASRHFHYRGGAYRWPGGYHYQRWSFGMTLPSVFWGQNYWIDDYQDYGLAYPPDGAVWVRYGDDALLIDRYSGEILEVVYGQFD